MPGFARRSLLAGLAATALPVLAVPGAAPPQRWRRALMGTWVDIEVAAPRRPAVEAAVQAAYAEMATLATMMSRFEPDGALGRLNAAAGRRGLGVPAELAAVLREARRLERETAGAFDIRVGGLTFDEDGRSRVRSEAEVSRALAALRHGHWQLDGEMVHVSDPGLTLDLGGVAKLPILAAGLAWLEAAGIEGVLINGGGDVLATPRPDGRPWHIGIRDPASPDELLAVLPLPRGVVASSGDYERYLLHQGRRWHHIVDPRSGRPTRGLHGVTLVGATPAEVNGLGTAAMVAGPTRAPALLTRLGARRALWVAEGGAVQASAALVPLLSPPPGRERVRGLG